MAISSWVSYPVELTLQYQGQPLVAKVYIRPHDTANWIFYKQCNSDEQHGFNLVMQLEFVFHQKKVLKVVFFQEEQQVGCVQPSLSELMITKERQFLIESPEQHLGAMVISASELKTLNRKVLLQFSGRSLADKDLFSLSDPFFTITIGEKLVYRSEVIEDSLNPQWRPFNVCTAVLCNNDFDRRFTISVYDYDGENVKPDLIGVANVCLHDLLTHSEFILSNSGGTLSVDVAHVDKAYTFLDYLCTGTDISVIAAIDFTESSLLVSNAEDYEKVIYDIGSIVEQYDQDKKFVAFGFGGPQVFAMNGNDEEPEVEGVEGIAQAYKQSLGAVLAGEGTLFTPLIERTCTIVRREAPAQRYYILLILTDGDIFDLEETKEALGAASDLPLSIVIVGVGDREFTAMEHLDVLHREFVKQRSAHRDLVQFVEYKKFVNNPQRLTQEVLAEIPSQFLSFTTMYDIDPMELFEVN